jgi:hypothetical protein
MAEQRCPFRARTITFYWRTSSSGVWAPPADLVKLIKGYNNSRVRTKLAKSRFSVEELEAAAVQVAEADSSVSAVALSGDSSGLIVETPSNARAAVANRQLRLVQKTTASKPERPGLVGTGLSLAALSPYITSYELAPSAVESLAIRQNDSSAPPGWKGGARVRWPVGNGKYRLCSSGFSVKYSKFVYPKRRWHSRQHEGLVHVPIRRSTGTNCDTKIINERITSTRSTANGSGVCGRSGRRGSAQ